MKEEQKNRNTIIYTHRNLLKLSHTRAAKDLCHRPLGSRDRFPPPLSASSMPKKAKNSKPQKTKNSKPQAPFWILVKYCNASTKWQWASKWILRSRPACGLSWNRATKPMSKGRKDAVRAWIQTQIYIEECLREPVTLYLRQ